MESEKRTKRVRRPVGVRVAACSAIVTAHPHPREGFPMRRLLAVLVLLVPFGLAAAPPPKPREVPAAYFPTQKGARWVYEYDGGEQTLVVTAVEEKGEEKHVWVAVVDGGKESPRERWAVSKVGLAFLATGPATLDRPIRMLRLPVKPGERWDFHAKGPRVLEQEGTYTVVGVEDVEVPAGKFKAVRVDVEVRAEGGKALAAPRRSRRWYAPGVGLVKVEFAASSKVLKSFARGN